MTLQWTAVATFLYVEIAVLIFFCLPFISAKRWQKIFKWSIWSRLSQFWNKGFLAMIIILIVLFLDALREVRKYSNSDQSKDAKLHPNMFDHMHMKLFRAQRNLYISGFSLFLWLVMRRVVTLISQLATAADSCVDLQNQVETTNKAAKKYMEDNQILKQALADAKEGGQKADPEESKRLKEELQRLKEELKTSADALKKSKSDLDTMKKQSDGLTKEYERLLQEHQQLQNQMDSGDKKEN